MAYGLKASSCDPLSPLYHDFCPISFEHSNSEIEWFKESPQNPTWSVWDIALQRQEKCEWIV